MSAVAAYLSVVLYCSRALCKVCTDLLERWLALMVARVACRDGYCWCSRNFEMV